MRSEISKRILTALLWHPPIDWETPCRQLTDCRLYATKNPHGALMIYDDKGRTVRWISNGFTEITGLQYHRLDLTTKATKP